jgi:hypothetical protein
MGYTTYRLHGYHFWAEGIFQRFEHPSLQIEVTQIIIHKVNQPDIVVNFFDADGLPGDDRAEIDFFVCETDAATASDHDRFVVKRISAALGCLKNPSCICPTKFS